MVENANKTVIDLFAGCGGLTEGFVQAGFEPIKAVEWDLAAASTYATNFGGDHVFWGDIEDVPDSDIPKADVVVGGPPCQGFSNLGTRDPGDPRNRLWREYVRLVRLANPSIFVIENVDRFKTSLELQLLLAEIDGGALDEYNISYSILNAADYGTPQRRRRAIVVGSRVGPARLPAPTHSKGGTDGLRSWETVATAFDGVPWEAGPRDLPDSRTEFFAQLVKGVFKLSDLHLSRNPRAISLERYDHVPPGGGRFDLPDELLPNCWRNKPTGTTDVMGRMRWDKPSLTIRTEFFKPEKGQYLHPQWDADDRTNRVNRPITHLEATRLQGFPDDFGWCGSKIEIAKQIGNAVPVPLARAIARDVASQLGQ